MTVTSEIVAEDNQNALVRLVCTECNTIAYADTRLGEATFVREHNHGEDWFVDSTNNPRES